MESSDDSFVWTNASSDSEGDSDTMSIRKMNNSDHDDVSKSGKKYKKQLQTRLFEGRGSPSGDRVKCEPPSDADDSYLELRVKLERAAASTHDTTTLSESSLTHRPSKSKKKKKKRERDEPSDKCDDKATSSRIEDEALGSTPRKKKFKGERDSGDAKSYEMNGMIIEDKFSAEETVVEARPSSDRRSRRPISNGKETDVRTERRISKVKPDGAFTSKEFISDESDLDDDAEERRKSEAVLTSRLARRSSTRDTDPTADRVVDAPAPDRSHRTSKLSDRIRFEDDDTADDSMDVDTSEIRGESGARSAKVGRYLSSRGHLRACAYRPRAGRLLARDDEAWLLTCPHEVHVSALLGATISLDDDAKCRIKLDGQTYNGSVDDRDARMNVLSVEHDRTVIVNVPVSGTVRFRKRIPKAHFVQDGIVRNDRTDFIPLPETKCRHPLFGPDYRRAVRIPSSVRDRLNRPDVEDPPTRKKKKHKKERVDADAPAPEAEAEAEAAAEPRRSKKRKHRHTDTELEEPTVKKKRVKHEPSSAAAWDSEKAIEENLFNF